MTDQDIQRIIAAVGKNFETFGGGSRGSQWNPLVEALKNEPLMFALGVSVEAVVRFILNASPHGTEGEK